jgi:hypothetical protein
MHQVDRQAVRFIGPHQVDRQAVRFIGPEDQANLAGPHRWRGLVGQHMGAPNPGGGGVHRVSEGRGV